VSGQTSQTSNTIAVSATAESVGGDAIVDTEIFDGRADLGPATPPSVSEKLPLG